MPGSLLLLLFRSRSFHDATLRVIEVLECARFFSIFPVKVSPRTARSCPFSQHATGQPPAPPFDQSPRSGVPSDGRLRRVQKLKLNFLVTGLAAQRGGEFFNSSLLSFTFCDLRQVPFAYVTHQKGTLTRHSKYSRPSHFFFLFSPNPTQTKGTNLPLFLITFLVFFSFQHQLHHRGTCYAPHRISHG